MPIHVSMHMLMHVLTYTHASPFAISSRNLFVCLLCPLCTCLNTCLYTFVDTSMHACPFTFYTHIYPYFHVHVCSNVCIHFYAHVCTHVCTHRQVKPDKHNKFAEENDAASFYVRACCACACVRACVRARARARTHRTAYTSIRCVRDTRKDVFLMGWEVLKGEMLGTAVGYAWLHQQTEFSRCFGLGNALV